MRRWGIVAGVAAGAGLGLSLGSIAWPIEPGHVAADLALAMGGVDTPVVEAPATATLTLLPRPTLRMTGVKIRAANGAVSAEAESGEVTLRLDRLLIGQFAPLGLSLQEADIRVDVDAAQAALAALERPPVQRLTLQGGEIEIFGPKKSWSARVEISSARADWPRAGSRLRLVATGRWRSQPVEASADLDAPLAATHGDASPLRIAIDAPLAQLRFSGDWSPNGRLDERRVYRGDVSALIPSIARFSRWLGRAADPSPSTLELNARASGDMKMLSLADARIVLGGQPFEGALDLLKTPKGLSASGTLAADALDLAPLIGPPPALTDETGEWSNVPILPKPSQTIDLDLRVSATHAVWGGHALDNAAAAVSERDGRFGIKLLEAGFAHTTLSGEISVENRQGDCETRLSLAMDNADFGALLADFGDGNLSGQGTLKASIRARGRSPADIVASADGDGSLEMVDGALSSLNFEEALRRGQRRPLDVARDMNAGATHFASATGRVEISDGEARFIEAGTRSPGVSLSLTGALDLMLRVWRARIEARQSTLDGEPTPDGAHMEFALVGPWATPVLAPISPPAD